MTLPAPAHARTLRNGLWLALAALCGFAASELLHWRSGAAIRDEIHLLSTRLDALAGRGAGPTARDESCSSAVETLRAEVRNAALSCQAAGAGRTGGTSGAAAAAGAPSPSVRRPEAEAALRQGRAIVARALASGVWTEQDAAALRIQIAQVDVEGLQELLRELTPAMNDGRLRVLTTGSPF